MPDWLNSFVGRAAEILVGAFVFVLVVRYGRQGKAKLMELLALVRGGQR